MPLIKRPHHIPHSDPCVKCGFPASKHVVNHQPRQGDACDCGAPWENHAKPFDGPNKKFVGIDGEGEGRTPHRYTLLAYSDYTGKTENSVSSSSLTTVDCLELILTIPSKTNVFAYAFNYDLTMMLKDLPDEEAFLLFHADKRRDSKFGKRPIKWNGYEINLQSSQFSVKRIETGKTVIIWDCFKFFQCKFTKALTDWQIATATQLQEMEAMKALRGTFESQSPERIKAYCLEECRRLAKLMTKLKDSHDEAGIPLKTYYGAGSSASALLTSFSAKTMQRATPEPMVDAVARSFFGGRFENSRIGVIHQPVHAMDISSAYPYQIYSLPDLAKGQWTHTLSEPKARASENALIHCTLRSNDVTQWGPFPFRHRDGAISFPGNHPGAWVWDAEYRSALKLWENSIDFVEAWIFETSSDCKPFSGIANIYNERLRLGEDGKGLALKGAMNASYGKMAQSIGKKPPYRCPIYASMITSRTRGQLLGYLSDHVDIGDVIALATDGLFTLSPPPIPVPLDTATNPRKPLGGWTRKVYPDGMFFARPGIYFPLKADENSISQFKARGLGRKALYDSHREVIDGYLRGDKEVKAVSVDRFIGAKSTLSRDVTPEGFVYKRSERYGSWEQKIVKVTFDPYPKRTGINDDNTLRLRSIPEGETSAKYAKFGQSDGEGLSLLLASLFNLETPELIPYSFE